jgi:hypothetical protein
LVYHPVILNTKWEFSQLESFEVAENSADLSYVGNIALPLGTGIGVTWGGALGTVLRTAGIYVTMALSMHGDTPKKYYGEGPIATTLPIPFWGAIPHDISRPTTLPISLPTDIPNQKPTDGDKCSVYVIWQTDIDGRSEVSKYGITCQLGSDGQQSCGRPEEQCSRFMKDVNKPKDIISYSYRWLVGGNKPPILIPHVNLRTALFIEKTMTAWYLINNIGTSKAGLLPPKHKIPCFKLDDPFDPENIDRTKRAEEWIRDAKNKYGL